MSNLNQSNPFMEINEQFIEIKQILADLSKKIASEKSEPNNPHERLTRADIKKQYKVSFGTIHNAMKAGKLAYDKVGRKTLFKRVEVENWINKKA
jgi:hypothetical protein